MHTSLGVSRRKCLEGQRRGKGGADNYWLLNTCSAGRAYISPSKFITCNGEHSFLFVATCSLSELYTKYLTAILESIIYLDCFIIREW